MTPGTDSESTRSMGLAPPPTLEDVSALLVDLDGVLTKTAVVHAAAWKQLFDEFFARRSEREHRPFEPFDVVRDYRAYVDGKPRYDGVQSVLASRGISLPYGSPDDPPDAETVCGLGNRKNAYFNRRLAEAGVEVYPDTVALLAAARKQGVRLAVVSSSENCEAVVRAAGLEGWFDVRVDGVDLARLGLRGKPAPDMFREAAARLGVEPKRAAVLEDAVAGVEAGHRGGFGLVVGVDRGGHSDELRRNGADIALSDLRDLLPRRSAALPSALDSLREIRQSLQGREPAVFLDYDGTLTPIADRPELAVLGEPVRETVRDLARLCPVVVVSGRDRADVQRLVGLDSLVYAGSQGFDIAGPDGFTMQHEEGADYASVLGQAEAELRQRLGGVAGVLIEPKRYALAVHYRLAATDDHPRVEMAVDQVAAAHPRLRKTGGKMVFELRPRLAWDKGKAVLWLLTALGLDRPDVLPFYLGDDLTDEDAFAALANQGIGIVVGDPPAAAISARYRLDHPEEVRRFLAELIAIQRARQGPVGG